MGLPSQITAAALSTLVILGVAMLDSLNIITLEPDQLTAVSAFVVAASNLGFGVLLWYVNRGVPNPTAPVVPPGP
jgi:hypothetical protein